MGDFGSLPLASKFGIVLGGLIVLTVTAGLIKVLFNRRRLKKATKYAEIEAARNHTEKVLQREFREGDLFGVRAIEHGFFGGVSQSRPSTPSPLSKSTTLDDTNSSVSPIRSMTPSTAKAPTTAAKHMKHKPTPLRLNPHETTSRTRNDGFKSPGHELSPIHLSPLPLKPRGSVRSLKSNGSNGEWVSPLDVHFDRPHSPTTPIKERPYSYSPRLQFPEGKVRKNPVLESNSIDLKSEAASFHSGAETVTQKNSPTFSLYPNSTPRASRSSKVVITPDGETTEARQPSRGNLRLDAIPTPPLPDGGGYFDFGIPPRTAENQERAVIRDSVARVHRVSTYQPQRHRSQSPDTEPKSRERSASDISEKGSSTVFKHSRTRTRSSETYGQIKSHKRSTSSHSITRTRDSLLSIRHSRKISEDKGNRRSRDRDQLHYDPHNHRRNRSGSVQGRVVDFDNPRVNPFVDGYATSSNQPDGSTSVSQDINHVLANRVSHMKPKVAGDSSGGYIHKRTGTNESQGDIRDLVDSYYRASDASGYGQRATSVSKRGSWRKDSRSQRGPQDTINEFPLPVRHSRGPGFL